MGKQEKQTSQGNRNRFKKQYNNYNPYNKLELNKFHQINSQEPKKGYGHQLNKRKRDIDRMIQYRKKKGLEVDQQKVQQIEQIKEQITDRKKIFEKEQRKEFFIGSKYKQIMNIQKRKVAKKIREIKEAIPIDREILNEWYKKLNYIKHYPKTLKYIALFPNSEMNQMAKEFQQKIMNDIEEQMEKKKSNLNSFETEYKQPLKPVKKEKKDDFFLQEVEQVQLGDSQEEQVDQQ